MSKRITITVPEIGRVWLANTAENVASSSASAMLGALGSSALHLIGDIPWYGVLSAGAFAGLTTFLTAVASLRVPNGTASFVPDVIAKP